ncbi:hypothetical protein AXF42_Ash014528 [Apostasia shenzhenica]|uniref:Uncharacterized protein n=1 Tax=Apostasia shenzhenica TaxID=1088818 RepID=A0A2H9ZWS0_9ASPA|nr:hypothetical protein AXF42_Ash014528 [Apostasia shenzhenica]
MASRINSYSLPILHNISLKSPNPQFLFHSRSICCAHPPKISHSSSGGEETRGGAATPAPAPPSAVFRVRFQTLEACKLGIGRYPDFDYDAKGGCGTARGEAAEGTSAGDRALMAAFDVDELYIPPLTGKTTRFLGLPLPPLLKIDIAPEVLQGTICRDSGKVELQFRARFWFSIGTIYRAPPLLVETKLTTEESRGSSRSGAGERMDENGRCRLVGVAAVDTIDDLLMNSFLGLPTECLADLNAKITVTVGP